MISKEKIVEKLVFDNTNLEKLYAGVDTKIGIDTQSIASTIGLHRTEVSRILNKLTNNGVLCKISGRPVMYVHRHLLEKAVGVNIDCDNVIEKDELLKSYNSKYKNKDDVFVKNFGEIDSISEQIKQAKAAIRYPPNGLHTLITGPTGSGKTLLAETMYQYALQVGRVSSKSMFVRFNCSDYANNPNLLLSQLFGHKAGAFTDARKDKKGLVELADGGVLFLDEVHSLPAQGQEMLFTLIDKGTFMRLGDTDEKHVNLLLIMATSYNPKKYIIPTLYRRISNVIEMPGLADRPLKERLNLIKRFFKCESNNMKRPIVLTKEALQVLLSYECPGNIGQLKSDIKNICSKIFIENDNKQDPIKLEIDDIPNYITTNISYNMKFLTNISKVISGDIVVYPETNDIGNSLYADYISLYSIVEREFKVKKEISYSDIKHSGIIYLNQFAYIECNINDAMHNKLFKQIRAVVDNLNIASDKKHNLAYGIFYYLLDVQKGLRLKRQKLLRYIKQEVDNFCMINRVNIDNILSSSLNNDSLLICKWLCCIQIKQTDKQGKIILIGRDFNKISQIANITNRLLGINSIEYLNLYNSSGDIDLEHVKHLKAHNSLVIIEPDFISYLLKDLFKKYCNIEAEVLLNQISTTYVVVAANKAVQNEWDLERTKREMLCLYQSNSEDKLIKPICIVIINCDKDESIGHRIKDTLNDIIRVCGIKNLKMIVLSLNQIGRKENLFNSLNKIRDSYQLYLIIDLTGICANYSDIEIIEFHNLLGKGIVMKLINDIKHNKSSKCINNNLNDYKDTSQIIGELDKYLSFLDLNKAMPILKQGINIIENQLNLTLNIEQKNRWFVYSSTMLERILRNVPIKKYFIDDVNKDRLEAVNTACYILEKIYYIQIPEIEKKLLTQIVFNNITQQH